MARTVFRGNDNGILFVLKGEVLESFHNGKLLNQCFFYIFRRMVCTEVKYSASRWLRQNLAMHNEY